MTNLAMAFVEEDLPELDRAAALGKAADLLDKGATGLKRLIQVAPESRIVLVIDQFEEAFTRCENDDEREQYLATLMGALEGIDEKLCLIIAMRSDFIVKCHEREYSGLAQRIDENLVSVTPMKADEIKSAIIKPAEQVGLDIEGELVTEIINDIQDAPGSLPLLQYTLKELWQDQKGNQLQLSTYQALGGIQGTLDKRATAIYEGLDEAEQLTVQHIFQQLTQLGEDTEDTRRRILQDDLVSEPKHSAERVQAVIAKLSSKENRLLVTSDAPGKSSEAQPVAIVDVAHEALIRHWKLLRQWIEENQDTLRKQRQIEPIAVFWQEQRKRSRYLLQGLTLSNAENLLIQESDIYPLSALAKTFIKKSQQQRKRSKIAKFLLIFIPLGAFAENIAAENLVQGCHVQKKWPWLPDYLSERLFGNCRLLSSASLKRASLSYTNLHAAHLHAADLQFANLNEANLNSADLSYTDLRSANLSSANLRSADFSSADLRSASLRSASLHSANLSYADLSSADLSYADLRSANLRSANLSSVDLSYYHPIESTLRPTNLYSADLSDADLSSTILLATDLRQTKKLNQKQFKTITPPLLCNSPLPNHIEINPDRDCDKIPIILTQRYPTKFGTLEKGHCLVKAWWPQNLWKIGFQKLSVAGQ